MKNLIKFYFAIFAIIFISSCNKDDNNSNNNNNNGQTCYVSKIIQPNSDEPEFTLAYDANNNLISIIGKVSTSVMIFDTAKAEITYSNNKPIRISYKNFDHNNTFYPFNAEYAYDTLIYSSSNIIEKKCYLIESGVKRIIYQWNNTFNSNNKVVRTTEINTFYGGTPTYDTTNYYYNSLNNIDSTSFRSGNRGDSYTYSNDELKSNVSKIFTLFTSRYIGFEINGDELLWNSKLIVTQKYRQNSNPISTSNYRNVLNSNGTLQKVYYQEGTNPEELLYQFEYICK